VVDLVGLEGRLRRGGSLTWLRWFTAVFAVSTLEPLVASLRTARTADALIVGLTLVFVASWVVVVWRSTPWLQRVASWVALLTTVVSGALLELAHPRQWLGTVPFLVITALVLSSRPAPALTWSVAVPATTMLVGIGAGLGWVETAEFAVPQLVLGVTLVVTHSVIRAMLALHRLRILAHDQGQEIERLRLAREIHDSLGRDLVAVVLRSQSIADDMRADPVTATRDDLAREIEFTAETARHALETVRAIVNDVHVSDLCDEVAQARDFLRSAGIALTVIGEVPADRVLAAVLREAVTNVVRHAHGATRCVVRFQARNHQLSMTIHDDGHVSAPVLDGYGIRGMRERVEARSGSLHVRHLRGHGVQVSVDLPLGAATATEQPVSTATTATNP